MLEAKNLSLREFQDLAFDLGKKWGKRDLVLGLIGPLGSGKTTFVKSFAKALGLRKIKSPSFTLLASYPLHRRRHLYHLDLYRLNRTHRLDLLGIQELLHQKNRLLLIEWVDKFPRLKSVCDLLIQLTIRPQHKRHVKII